jgi:hypothetical protein
MHASVECIAGQVAAPRIAATASVPRGMHQAQGKTAVRRIVGVLSLSKKYGVARVDNIYAPRNCL